MRSSVLPRVTTAKIATQLGASSISR